MNLKRCENGHFYDADKYEICPKCRQPETDDDVKTMGITPPERFHNQPSKHSVGRNVRNNIKDNEEKTSRKEQPIPDIPEPIPARVDIKAGEIRVCPRGHYYNSAYYDSCPECDRDPEKGPTMPGGGPEVHKVPDNNGGTGTDTIPGKNPTTIDGLDNSPKKPVVGWLVAIEGSCYGESFQIREGQNSIGRDADNDIVIKGDKEVSATKHAFVIFDPKGSKFYVRPGEAHGLTYLNDECLLEGKAINDHDLIKLGDTSLMFVPLCGNDFSWDKYKNKDTRLDNQSEE